MPWLGNEGGRLIKRRSCSVGPEPELGRTCAFQQTYDSCNWCASLVKGFELQFCYLCYSHRLALCKEIQASLLLLDSRPWIPASRYWIPDSLSLKIGFPDSNHKWDPDSLSCIPDSKVQDSRFLKLNFPGFRNPESEFHNPKSEFRNPESEFQNPESEFQNPKSEFQNQESEFRNPESEFQNPESGFTFIWDVSRQVGLYSETTKTLMLRFKISTHRLRPFVVSLKLHLEKQTYINTLTHKQRK